MNFEAVLFDCDGVLVDSEPITNGVLRESLIEAGWAISREDCERLFIGRAVRDLRERIETETGKPFTDAWLQAFYARRNTRLMAELNAIEGVHDAVAHLHAHTKGRIACASGADRAKVVMQLDKVGLSRFFGDAIFSGHDLPRSKPAPDVYLAAAAHLGVDPTRCLVIEDTAPGAQAGLAAGATVWGFCTQGHGRAFDGLPVARVFHHMRELRL
ncbi:MULTISPECIES: HAD family hydrolase [Hydrogenophaga]|uniref:HAD family hydrolase n=2 Tax=Hydrogenophaga TaxID=47420 RepID=A0A1L1PFJ5_HYDIT|nr:MULTISPECIES: HAD family phosphatase [Hydrogenophaga]AOS77493.1 HAD family hydrolase [Hydrogenophaga sp. PBC]TMU74061.1 HAD family phosphatase [Hydrogenophaga intermedia]CDN86773.1 HAD family hydrolase [Hydrogenophaga intermedia]